MVDTVSLTYRQLADRLGITIEGARLKTKRRKWATEPGNHPSDPIRVHVPIEALPPTRGNPQLEPFPSPTLESVGPNELDSVGPRSTPTLQALQDHIESLQQTVETLRQTIDYERSERTAERSHFHSQVERLEAQVAQIQTQSAVERERLLGMVERATEGTLSRVLRWLGRGQRDSNSH
jgi:hypothetical protein